MSYTEQQKQKQEKSVTILHISLFVLIVTFLSFIIVTIYRSKCMPTTGSEYEVYRQIDFVDAAATNDSVCVITGRFSVAANYADDKIVSWTVTIQTGKNEYRDVVVSANGSTSYIITELNPPAYDQDYYTHFVYYCVADDHLE